MTLGEPSPCSETAPTSSTPTTTTTITPQVCGLSGIRFQPILRDRFILSNPDDRQMRRRKALVQKAKRVQGSAPG